MIDPFFVCCNEKYSLHYFSSLYYYYDEKKLSNKSNCGAMMKTNLYNQDYFYVVLMSKHIFNSFKLYFNTSANFVTTLVL